MTTEAQKTADRIGYHFDLAANSVRCATSAGRPVDVTFYTQEAKRHRTMGIEAFWDYVKGNQPAPTWPLVIQASDDGHVYRFENKADLQKLVDGYREEEVQDWQTIRELRERNDRQYAIIQRLENEKLQLRDVAADRLGTIEDLSEKLADAERRLRFVARVIYPKTELVEE